jgi:signal transduction histidine kinase
MILTRKIIISICLLAVIPFLVFCYLYIANSFQKDWLVVLITAFIIILGAKLLINLNRALIKLYKSLKKITRGDFNYDIDAAKISDVTEMASSINRVTRKLRESADELEKKSILIERHNQEVRKMNELKSMYFSDFAHELRAPLINIDKSSSLLLERKIGIPEDERDSCLKSINNNTKHLMRLINNLLEISKIESGQLRIEYELLDARQIIKEAITAVDKWRESKNLMLDVRIAPDLLKIYADRDRIVQVIINLLSNGIKYTLAGGSILIEAENFIPGIDSKLLKDKERFISIAVEDTGIGIPEDQRGKIFERYKTVEDKSLKILPSTGLGLSIAKQIVQMHGGKIWLESQKGKGSRFTFILPQGSMRKTKDIRHEIQKSNKRILVIDDEDDIRELLNRELNKKGYSVTSARNGLQALKMALDISYDLVITDIRMPNIEGTDCIQILKLLNPDAFFMVITGFPVEQRLKEILERNSYPCINKPFNLPEFLEKVDGLCVAQDTEWR